MAFLAAQGRKMSELEAAWLAGLLEGEGSFMVTNRGGRQRARISLTMTDRDVMERIVTVTGTGNVRLVFRTTARPNNKDEFAWQVCRLRDAYAITVAVLPHLGERRTIAAERIVDLYNQKIGGEL